ncbi:MAG: AAA family ATPase [Rothia sp. (in: high G+C Gram-positive bacteria)]|nr:AAA family ATPase [Rothia sp. (in: high G+C Gram-positive bacteria)]
MPLIVSISSLKGGVGKTSVTLGLASAALAAGKHVLVIDMDPHGDASTGLFIGEGGTEIGTMLKSPKKFNLSAEVVPSGWNALAEATVIENQLQTEAQEFSEDDEFEDDAEFDDESEYDREDLEDGEHLEADDYLEDREELFEDDADDATAEDGYDELDEGYEYVTDQAPEAEYEDEFDNESDEIAEDNTAPSDWSASVGSIDVVRGSAASNTLENLTFKRALPRLRQLLDDEVEDYDLVLIDCPPTLGNLTSMAWASSDRVISIAEPSLFSVAGTERTLRAIARFEENNKYSVESASVVVNMAKLENPEHVYRIEEMKTLFGDLVAEPVLPAFNEFQRIQGSAYPVHFWPAESSNDFAQKLSALLDGLLDRKIPWTS